MDNPTPPIDQAVPVTRIALEDVTSSIAAVFADDACLIWSGEWQAYWRAGGNGYTKSATEAGWYTISAAYERTRHCDPSKQIAFERTSAPRPVAGEVERLRQEVAYLSGVPAGVGWSDHRAPEVDAAILRCRKRGDDATAEVIGRMRLAYAALQGAADQGGVREAGHYFNRGVLIAAATLINCWGHGTESAHLLKMIDADVAMVESMQFTDYDHDPLIAALTGGQRS